MAMARGRGEQILAVVNLMLQLCASVVVSLSVSAEAEVAGGRVLHALAYATFDLQLAFLLIIFCEGITAKATRRAVYLSVTVCTACIAAGVAAAEGLPTKLNRLLTKLNILGLMLQSAVVLVTLFWTMCRYYSGGITAKATRQAVYPLVAVCTTAVVMVMTVVMSQILARGQVHTSVAVMFMLQVHFLVSVGIPIFGGAIMAWARRRERHTWIIGSFIPQVLLLVSTGILGAIRAIAGGNVVHLWTELSIHILIVLSFLLQVFLLISAGIRRRSASAAHRICLWLAYLLADNVALYALGHMTLNSMSHVDPLVIFWVPFFLLHLGGQDTITAYSLEDNQLWLRHLLTLLVQVSGGAYILCLHITGTRKLILPTILMFMVGVIKYLERVWALKCANIANLGTSLDIVLIDRRGDLDAKGASVGLNRRGDLDAEQEVLLGAHYLFSYCKSKLVDRKATVGAFAAAGVIKQGGRFNSRMYMYELVEMELSLMYDFLYTKVPVIHTWHGCFIRVVSLLGTGASFLLFQIGGHGAYSRVDVGITYFLLVGAIVLEMTSLLRALWSTWTCALLHARNWDRIHAVVVRLRRLVKAASNRRWLHSIGQHNLLDFCSHDKTKLTGRITNAVGLEDWWNKLLHSSTTTIPPRVKEAVMEKIVQTMRRCHPAGLDITDVRGRALLTDSRIFDEINRIFVDKSFNECILIWHIATDIYLCSCKRQNEEEPFMEAMELLSNYMGFLLVVCPNLLPSGVSRSLYPDICSDLEKEWHELSTTKVKHGSRYSIGEDIDRTRISTGQEEDTSKQSTGQVEDRRRQSTGEMEGEIKISIKEEEGASKQSTGHVEVATNISTGEVEDGNEIREVEDGNEIREVEHENEIREVEQENEIREVEDGNIISTEEEGDGNHSMPTKRQKLAKHLLCKYNNSRYPTAYHKGSHLASKLLSNEWSIPNMPELIFAVWVEYLCYAAYHGTGVSHCRQLGSGGDFLTVIRLVIAHVELFELHRQDTEDHVEA